MQTDKPTTFSRTSVGSGSKGSGIVSNAQKAHGGVDYDALAAKHGGVEVQPIRAPSRPGQTAYATAPTTPTHLHLWAWLTDGQNGLVLAAGLSLIVSVVTVIVLGWTLRAIRRQTDAAEAQAAAARSQARLAELQIRDLRRGSRLGKRRVRIDGLVSEALGNADEWVPAGGRPMTGAGAVAVKAHELAEHLKLSQKAVEASLWRLEARGRAKDQGGTLDDARHWWTDTGR